MKDFDSVTILLVEDDATYRRPLSFMLERRGHRVVEVDSVADAVEAVRERQIDLVLADYSLPDGTGLDVMESEDSLGSCEASTPVIVMTSLPSAGLEAEVLSAGAVRLVSKSARAGPILEAVERALRRRRLD